MLMIKDKFESPLLANKCSVAHLKSKFQLLYAHVNKFLSNVTPDKCWKRLFTLKDMLGITNILHIAEICIAIPLSNAESEQIFSFCWRVFNKEWSSLKNSTLESLLRLRSDRDFAEERYEHAINIFLTEYPNGQVRKLPRHLDGHSYPSKRKAPSNRQGIVTNRLDSLVTEIDVNEISDSEWSDSSSDDEI